MAATKSKSKKKPETAKEKETKKRGRKYVVPDIQRTSVIRTFGDAYIKLLKKGVPNAKKKKGDLFDVVALFARAKWGSRDPWRRLQHDVDDPDVKDKTALDNDPDPYVPGADAATNDVDAEDPPVEDPGDEENGGGSDAKSKKPEDRDVQATRLSEIRHTLAEVLRTYARELKVEDDDSTSTDVPAASPSNPEVAGSTAAASQAYDPLLESYYAEGKGAPKRMFNFEGYAALHETEEWLEEIDRLAASRMETATSDKAKRAVKMNARREVYKLKWDAASEEDKAEALAEIEAVYQAEMEHYERSVKCEPKTVQDAVNFTSNAEKLLARTAQVVAEGTRGAVLIFLAAPRETEDGNVEVDVSTAEWASVPSALGRSSLKFSSIEKKQVWEIGSRLRYFGEKLFDANWTTELLKRAQICEDLARRERMKTGIVDEGAQVPKKGAGESANEEAPAQPSPPPPPSPTLSASPPSPTLSASPPSPTLSASPPSPTLSASPPSPTLSASPPKDSRPLPADTEQSFPEDDAPKGSSRRRHKRLQITSPSTTDSEAGSPSPPTTPIQAPSAGPAEPAPSAGPAEPVSAVKTLPPFARRAVELGPTNSRRSTAQPGSKAPLPPSREPTPSPAANAQSKSSTQERPGGLTSSPRPLPTSIAPAACVSTSEMRKEHPTSVSRSPPGSTPTPPSLSSRAPIASDMPGLQPPDKALEVHAPPPAESTAPADAGFSNASANPSTEGRCAQAAKYTSIFASATWNPREALSPHNPPSADGFDGFLDEKFLAMKEHDRDGQFGSRSVWRKFLVAMAESHSSWGVSGGIMRDLVSTHMDYEKELPPAAFSPCLGWKSTMSSDGKTKTRPVWLRKYFAAPRWCEVAAEDKEVDAETMDRDLPSTLAAQWAAVQPLDRLDDAGLIVAPPESSMEWEGRLNGGKRGVRAFVLGLILWASKLGEFDDGATSADWDMMAADVVLTLRVRADQAREARAAAVSAAAAAAAARGDEGKTDSAQALGKRKRVPTTKMEISKKAKEDEKTRKATGTAGTKRKALAGA